MDAETLEALLKLRIALERDQDWVAVGHVSYLLDKFIRPSETVGPRVTSAQISTALH